MGVEPSLSIAEQIIFAHTGKHLSDLQNTILRGVLQGKKYLDIAQEYRCTEGHIKDVGSLLWKLFSEALGEKVNKSNIRSVLKRRLKSELLVFSKKRVIVTEKTIAKQSNFVGRQKAIADLDILVNRGSKVIVIAGEGGVGKTSVAQQYLEQKFELVLELLMAKETQNIIAVESVVEEWLKRDLNEEPGREFGVTLARLKRHLETRQIGILIDNLEPALDRQGKFIASHRRYVELLRVLAHGKLKSLTIITSRDRLCESALNVEHYRLLGLDQQAWREFFCFHQIRGDRLTLETVRKIYGGNAKAMCIVCGVICSDFQGDLNAYWQENGADTLQETDLKNLVASQFNRLQDLDPPAYKLLCYLGCYRYQDIPVTKAELLFLLEVIGGSKNSIQSLKNRSLIEFSGGHYWLHPVIATEAIARLKTIDKWQEVQSKIAQYWTAKVETINTVEDALTALEAFYHYLEITDFEAAAGVILRSRVNRWGQFLPLGSTLYRIGLLQPVINAITQIIERVQHRPSLSELYNILGDLSWITGKINHAIACQEKAIAKVNLSLKILDKTTKKPRDLYYLKMLKVDSLLSIGLYKIDLWELPTAARLFEEVIALATNTPHHPWAEKASLGLALVHSYLGLGVEAVDPKRMEQLSEPTGRWAYFIQMLGQVYTNLGEFEQGTKMYQQAIAFSQASHYTQVKAKALTGLAEINREQRRFEIAYTYHQDAIELFDKIGAKCDLAQAYFQLGLTYQKMGKTVSSKTYFEQAIKMFIQMEAPQQVKKVRQVLS